MLGFAEEPTSRKDDAEKAGVLRVREEKLGGAKISRMEDPRVAGPVERIIAVRPP